jgi:hypothetical protein
VIRAKCPRCKGSGIVPLRTARADARCFCCRGAGFILRKPPTKRPTEQERLDDFNARLAELFPEARR